jgi:hypothetical protein
LHGLAGSDFSSEIALDCDLSLCCGAIASLDEGLDKLNELIPFQ